MVSSGISSRVWLLEAAYYTMALWLSDELLDHKYAIILIEENKSTYFFHLCNVNYFQLLKCRKNYHLINKQKKMIW